MNCAFRELIGSLMQLATQTCPDIVNSVRAVARYCAASKEVYWKTAPHMLRYVKAMSEYGIM